MPHPRNGYHTKDGTRVVSVTEVLKYKDPGPLMWWANKEGLAGRNHRDTSEKAATAGSLGHLLIETWAAGGDTDSVAGPPDELAKARAGFKSFLRWAELTRLQIVKSEAELVSEKYLFGGCLDSTMSVSLDGRLSLVDFKFSSGLYGEYLIQIAAYALLYEECFPGDKIEEYHILRFSKEHCDFSHYSWMDLSMEKEAFLDLLHYHQKKVLIDKRAK